MKGHFVVLTLDLMLRTRAMKVLKQRKSKMRFVL